jgi:hypothetical protein
MIWIVGERYELVEKGGLVMELGRLVAIKPDGMEFKKKDGCSHVYVIELGVKYRTIRT